MNTLYTIGYGNQRPDDFFARIPTRSVIIDVRLRPFSWWQPAYRKGRLQRRFGDHYRSVPALGNTSTDAAVWKPEDEAAAKQYTAIVSWYLDCTPVVLLCAEGKAFDDAGKPRCHRVHVANALAELLPGLEIIHL